MNINHERLVPGAITYWGDVVGDITDQQDLVDYVASHGGGGGGDATWGSIQGTLSNQTDLNDRLTEINGLAQDAYNQANTDYNMLNNHIAANDAAFAEAFSRISALEQGGGGGGVTPEEFNAHKAQNTEEFQIVDGRLTALEQNPGVSQQAFDAHAAQNAAQFQAIDNQFQNYATRDYANQLYQSSIDITNQSVSGLSTSIDELRNDLNNTVTTQQCEEPGLTDYLLTSLIWTNSNAILAMDDYYTGDNGENRDVTIWGSYMDENDDSRVKFGKVKTTYEQDPNTQEYTVTGQSFEEMVTLPSGHNVIDTVNVQGNVQDIPEDYPLTEYCNHNIEIGNINSNFEYYGISISTAGQVGYHTITMTEDDPEENPGVYTYHDEHDYFLTESQVPFADTIPDSVDGVYVLKATVQDGEVTYEWVPDNVL